MKQDIVARTGAFTQALITSDAGMFSNRELKSDCRALTLLHALIAMASEASVVYTFVVLSVMHGGWTRCQRDLWRYRDRGVTMQKGVIAVYSFKRRSGVTPT